MDDPSPHDPPEADLETPPPPREPSPWHPVARIGLFLGLFLAVQVVVAFPALVLWAGMTGSNPLVLLQGEGVAAYTLFSFACTAPVLVPLTVAFLRRIDGKSVAELGWRAPDGGNRGLVVQGVVATAVAAAVLGTWLVVVGWLGELSGGGLAAGFAEGAGPLRGMVGGASLLALQALAWVVQAGVEEWVFRGYVFRTLRERWSWASAAGASSLIFAVFHTLNRSIDAAALVNTFLLGLILAAALESTGSLWASTVFHAGWNFTMAGLLSLPVSGVGIFHLLDLSVDGPAWLTGGEYGPEGSWALTALLVPLVLAMARRVDRQIAVAEAGEGGQSPSRAP